MTALDAIEELSYLSYRANRQLNPAIPAREWERLFGLEHGQRYERRYQEELGQKFERWLVNAQNRIEAHAFAEFQSGISPANKQFECDREAQAVGGDDEAE
jgi:hypothetical protein